MVTCNVQLIYDKHVAALSAGERLRLVELITRGMAQPSTSTQAQVPVPALREMPGWQPGDRRGDRSEWRDRTL
jgi:hypothetical protein